MSLNATTQKVIKLVEEKTGLPVHVEPDSSLPATQLAKVVIARGSLRLHHVLYRPGTAPDYLICQQCGFVLRLFGVPPEERYDMTFSAAADEATPRLVKAHSVVGGLAADASDQLVQMLRDCLLNHLRSTPVGMRVDEWLATDFPELADEQQKAVLRQVEDAATTLAPRFRQVSPKPIFNPTQTISSSRRASFLNAGEELLEIWHSTPR
jgi:hypothetical protein